MSAIGGENVSTTIEGRERYPINVRYPRELRDDPTSWPGCSSRRCRRADPAFAARRHPAGRGPFHDPRRKREASGYVYVDVDTSKRDIGGYIEDAKAAVARN
jgi:Cu(I)/Ag(I) efflux system membrane protein CusA/SilA